MAVVVIVVVVVVIVVIGVVMVQVVMVVMVVVVLSVVVVNGSRVLAGKEKGGAFKWSSTPVVGDVDEDNVDEDDHEQQHAGQESLVRGTAVGGDKQVAGDDAGADGRPARVRHHGLGVRVLAASVLILSADVVPHHVQDARCSTIIRRATAAEQTRPFLPGEHHQPGGFASLSGTQVKNESCAPGVFRRAIEAKKIRVLLTGEHHTASERFVPAAKWCVTSQRRAGTPFANQRRVTCLPVASLAGREPSAARGSQSDTSTSLSLSANGYTHIKGTTKRFRSRNERAGESGDPRENPPTSGIVREFNPRLHRSAASSGTISTSKYPGVTRSGIEPGSPRWEANSLTTTTPRPHDKIEVGHVYAPLHGNGSTPVRVLSSYTDKSSHYNFPKWIPSGALVLLLSSHPGEPGSSPTGVATRFSHVRFVPDDAASWWIFSGISRFPRPCIPYTAQCSPHFTPIGSRDLKCFGPLMQNIITSECAQILCVILWCNFVGLVKLSLHEAEKYPGIKTPPKCLHFAPQLPELDSGVVKKCQTKPGNEERCQTHPNTWLFSWTLVGGGSTSTSSLKTL
ncbi:hypothetical protein PR048_027546 [Dryococelus australis]|uniref:Uncharacterized protein n=1 Tax=Dryococelus australis TaxID=614101 RepID=A0ABQ9GGU8_9NEOP|nr:hypothetical protein PR048_027546 [Dryococelus australis]